MDFSNEWKVLYLPQKLSYIQIDTNTTKYQYTEKGILGSRVKSLKI